MNDGDMTITGNMTRDPELRFTPSGTAVANFGVAVEHRTKNRQTDEWESKASFVDVTAWQDLATNVANLTKGTRVTVRGRVDQESWVAKDESTRSKLVLVADDIAVSLRWGYPTGFQKTESLGGGQGSQREKTYNPNEEPFETSSDPTADSFWS